MWNLGWTGRDWISLSCVAFQTSDKGPHKVPRGHTSCSHGEGSKKALSLPCPPFWNPLLCILPSLPVQSLSTRLPKIVLSAQGWPLQGCLHYLLLQKGPVLHVNGLSPSVVVWTTGFDVTKVVHMRACVIDGGQSGGGELVYAKKLLCYYF